MDLEPNRAESIVDAALELPSAERQAFLDQACQGDAHLRQLVDGLLQAHRGAEVFVQQPSAATIQHPIPRTEKPGDRIGRYKLLQQLGEGGCGVVYMAEQQEPVKRRVALKVIKLGMDTRQVIARFEAERQALALMDHANIAKVLDGGVTENGRPFFVMELVRGIPITRYCDENRLDTIQRLELFIRVCQAIQHAHQRGIIHRDIKPSNILVADHDGLGVPKVIDFGIAKATAGQTLTDKTLFTAFEQFIGTPAYMSPEQARLSGLEIDSRSDIYSLGVLLYELLTGKTPFDARRLMQAGLDEIRRIIQEEDPPRPSTRLSTLDAAEQTTIARQRQTEPIKLVGMARGDLDWIVMKTLEKDRARRYESASGLALDLRRHLSNEPVLARPPSNIYRFKKFVLRNKLAFSLGTALAVVLILGATAGGLFAFAMKLTRQQKSRPLSNARRIAVLPWSNANPGKVEAYLADSLTSELIRALSRVGGMSAFRVPALQAAQSADQIRALLSPAGVPLLVEGSADWSEGKTVISGRLSETAAGGFLVSTNYVREAHDVLGLPNDLALAIAEHAGIELTTELRNRITKRPTESAEAYDSYLRGRFDLEGAFLRGPGTNAIPALERAVDLDSHFALAWAELSRAYVLNYFYSNPQETARLEMKATNALARALGLDPNLPEAHFAHGYFFWTHSQHWDVEKAIGAYGRAFELDPNSQELCDQLGLIFLHLGLFDEARKIGLRANRINPLNPLTHYLEANALFWQGKDEDAIKIWRGFPDSLNANFVMNSYQAVALVNLGLTNEAGELIEKGLRADPGDRGGLFNSARALLRAKEGDEIGAVTNILNALAQPKGFGHFHHALYNIASAYALLDKRKEALGFLKQAADDGFTCYPFLIVDKNLDHLHNSKEFDDFLASQKKLHAESKAKFGEHVSVR